MGVTKTWGAKDCSGGETSTGMYRINHNLNHTQYNVFIQVRESGVYAIVTGIYATYFTIQIRTFAGALKSAEFSFIMVGNN